MREAGAAAPHTHTHTYFRDASTRSRVPIRRVQGLELPLFSFCWLFHGPASQLLRLGCLSSVVEFRTPTGLRSPTWQTELSSRGSFPSWRVQRKPSGRANMPCHQRRDGLTAVLRQWVRTHCCIPEHERRRCEDRRCCSLCSPPPPLRTHSAFLSGALGRRRPEESIWTELLRRPLNPALPDVHLLGAGCWLLAAGCCVLLICPNASQCLIQPRNSSSSNSHRKQGWPSWAWCVTVSLPRAGHNCAAWSLHLASCCPLSGTLAHLVLPGLCILLPAAL